jgi:hypothetical protein
VAAEPSWVAPGGGREKKAWPARPAAGNHPERKLGERKKISFIKTTLYFQTYLIQNLNLNFK